MLNAPTKMRTHQRERFAEHDRREYRDLQRHDFRKEGAGMGGRCVQLTGVRDEHHRRTTAEHKIAPGDPPGLSWGIRGYARLLGEPTGKTHRCPGPRVPRCTAASPRAACYDD